MTRAQRQQCRLLAHWLGLVSCHACGKSFTVDQVASTLASVFRGHTGGVHPSTVKSLWFLCAGYDLHKDGHCDPSLPEHLHPIWRYPRSVTRHAEPGRAEDAPPHLGSCPQDENARQRDAERHEGRDTTCLPAGTAQARAVSSLAPDAAAHELRTADPTLHLRSTMMYELKVVRERRPEYRRPQTIMRSSVEVYELFRSRFERSDREEFIVVLLDAKNRMIGFHVVSVGSLTSSLVHPREVFKIAILGNAASVVLVHNHPSGDPTPSAEDQSITQRLIDLGTVLGIRILDHSVVGDGRYVSFVDDGLLFRSAHRAAAA